MRMTLRMRAGGQLRVGALDRAELAVEAAHGLVDQLVKLLRGSDVECEAHLESIIDARRRSRAWGHHPIPQGAPVDGRSKSVCRSRPRGSVAPVVPTVECEACGLPVELRAAACPRCGFLRASLASVLAQPSGGKSPRSAMWLSLGWPGAGHLYAGDTERGAIFGGVALVAGGLATVIAGPVLALVVWLGLALYTAIDSGRLHRIPRPLSSSASGAVSRVTKFGPVATTSPREGKRP